MVEIGNKVIYLLDILFIHCYSYMLYFISNIVPFEDALRNLEIKKLMDFTGYQEFLIAFRLTGNEADNDLTISDAKQIFEVKTNRMHDVTGSILDSF